MLQLARAIVGILADILRLGVSFLRSSSAIRVENLVLRRQLARYVERGIKPRRVDHVTRVNLALFTRLFEWRDTVVNVRPATIVRQHRLGWRIFWRRKCRAGRPPIPQELRKINCGAHPTCSIRDLFIKQYALEYQTNIPMVSMLGESGATRMQNPCTIELR